MLLANWNGINNRNIFLMIYFRQKLPQIPEALSAFENLANPKSLLRIWPRLFVAGWIIWGRWDWWRYNNDHSNDDSDTDEKSIDDKHKSDDVYLVNNMNDSVGGEDVSCCDPRTVGHHHLVKMRRRIKWNIWIDNVKRMGSSTPFQALSDRLSSWSDLLWCLLLARAPRPGAFGQNLTIDWKGKEDGGHLWWWSDDDQTYLHLLHRDKPTCQVREQVILGWGLSCRLNELSDDTWSVGASANTISLFFL